MDKLPFDLVNYVISDLLEDEQLINLYKCNKDMQKIKRILRGRYSISKNTESYSKLISRILINTKEEYEYYIKYVTLNPNIKY